MSSKNKHPEEKLLELIKMSSHDKTKPFFNQSGFPVNQILVTFAKTLFFAIIISSVIYYIFTHHSLLKFNQLMPKKVKKIDQSSVHSNLAPIPLKTETKITTQKRPLSEPVKKENMINTPKIISCPYRISLSGIIRGGQTSVIIFEHSTNEHVTLLKNDLYKNFQLSEIHTGYVVFKNDNEIFKLKI